MSVSVSVVDIAKEYLAVQHKASGYSSWLEGWACGFTDPYHNYENGDEVKEELLDFIKTLGKEKV